MTKSEKEKWDGRKGHQVQPPPLQLFQWEDSNQKSLKSKSEAPWQHQALARVYIHINKSCPKNRLPWKMGERLPHVILDFQLNHLILLDNKTWNILSSVRTIGNLLSVAPMQHYLLWHTLICNPVQMASFPSAKVWAKRQISKRPWERPSHPTDTLQELQDLYNLRNWYQFFFLVSML